MKLLAVMVMRLVGRNRLVFAADPVLRRTTYDPSLSCLLCSPVPSMLCA